MPYEELAAFFGSLQSGVQIPRVNLTEIFSDAGTKIATVFKSIVHGGNGAATEASQVVAIEEGAAAGTTESLALTTMDVGAFGAAVAPALGIIAGVGLYQLAPSFWDDVSAKLVNAGMTIGGKVAGFVNADGDTAFPEEAIEIFKNALIEYGAFEPSVDYPTFESPGTATATYTINSAGLSAQELLNAGISHIVWQNIRYDSQYVNTILPALETWASSRIGHAFAIIVSYAGSNDVKFGDSTAIIIYDLGAVGSTLSVVNGRVSGLPYFSIGADGYPSQGVYLIGYTYGNGTSSSFSFFKGESYYNAGSVVNYLNSQMDVTLTSNVQEDATAPEANIPFPTTYPNWLPWDTSADIPIPYPTGLGTPDITQDPSQTGENVLPGQLDGLIDILFNPALDDAIPDAIASDTDISVPLEEEAVTDIDITPNPPEPNLPIPIVAPIIDLPTLETTRADAMFTVYNPTDAQVNSLGGYLWTSNIIEQIKKMWEDPMQCIISFHKIYASPSTGGAKHIVLGYLDSEVSAAVVTSQFTDVNCGSVTISERLHNATDYSPFTKAMIYLPFCGIMDVDIADIMGSTVSVEYTVDVYTGTCLAKVYCQRTADMPTRQLLYMFSGNASQQLPLTGANFSGAVSALLGLAGAGVAVASGGAGLAVGGLSAAHSLTQEMVHMQRSGGLSANAGIMGPRKPFIILERQNGADATSYNSYYGYPANKTVYLGNCSGYTVVKDINYKGNATEEEKEEIVSLLKSGVIL